MKKVKEINWDVWIRMSDKVEKFVQMVDLMFFYDKIFM